MIHTEVFLVSICNTFGSVHSMVFIEYPTLDEISKAFRDEAKYVSEYKPIGVDSNLGKTLELLAEVAQACPKLSSVPRTEVKCGGVGIGCITINPMKAVKRS